jgi:hypothetical protein
VTDNEDTNGGGGNRAGKPTKANPGSDGPRRSSKTPSKTPSKRLAKRGPELARKRAEAGRKGGQSKQANRLAKSKQNQASTRANGADPPGPNRDRSLGPEGAGTGWGAPADSDGAKILPLHGGSTGRKIGQELGPYLSEMRRRSFADPPTEAEERLLGATPPELLAARWAFINECRQIQPPGGWSKDPDTLRQQHEWQEAEVDRLWAEHIALYPA